MATATCPALSSGIITADNPAALVVSTDSRTNGTVVKVSCYSSNSYTLKGSSPVTCVNGAWKPQQPSCVKNADLCPVLATDYQGLVFADNVNSLKVSTYERTEGTVVDISCYLSDTYTLQGSSKVTCKSGAWVPAPPICVKADSIVTAAVPTSTQLSTHTYVSIAVASTCAILFLLLLIVVVCKVCQRNSRKSSRVDSTSSIYQIEYDSRSSSAPGHSTLGTSPFMYSRAKVINSDWLNKNRSWTYITVDRLLRDIERSKRDNPNHSWRDFATMSSRPPSTD
ncbi:uncharacterized protein LOC131940012 [Physella acuta]|uniref:uncharacterized protein LOC131940012 n=1 Tax=Physella acuta TaxID=109671 RepID=UPI0027DC34AE|nr:uncharacterized protein LOC131940012 [Physella acuta]